MPASVELGAILGQRRRRRRERERSIYLLEWNCDTPPETILLTTVFSLNEYKQIANCELLGEEKHLVSHSLVFWFNAVEQIYFDNLTLGN